MITSRVNTRNMKWVKCFLGEKVRNGKFRITHDKIYQVYSTEHCADDDFWIICDNGEKGRFTLNPDCKPHQFGFIDATAEMRDIKINQILC